MNELTLALTNKFSIEHSDALELFNYLKKLVNDGENPENLLLLLGIDFNYSHILK